MDVLLAHPAHPVRKVGHVGHGGGEADEGHGAGQQNQGLLPHDAPLRVIHVVHLVKHHVLKVTQRVAAPVQHGAQHLGGHDEAGCGRVQCHVTGEEAGVETSGAEVAVLLVADRLDGAGINRLRFPTGCQRQRVHGGHRFPGAGVGGHKHVMPSLQMHDGLLLETIQLVRERVGQPTGRRLKRFKLTLPACWRRRDRPRLLLLLLLGSSCGCWR